MAFISENSGSEQHIHLFGHHIPPSFACWLCQAASPPESGLSLLRNASQIFFSPVPTSRSSLQITKHGTEHHIYASLKSLEQLMQFFTEINISIQCFKWEWMETWYLVFLVWFGDCGRQLWQPFKVTCHCEKAPGMCLEFTGSLWSFQKWCQKVKSDEKWASYEALKMSNFYQTKQWWRHSHSMIINKSQSVSFLHHTNQNYHPARFPMVINHLIRNTQSFAIFVALPRIFHNFSETPAGPRGGEKKLFLRG